MVNNVKLRPLCYTYLHNGNPEGEDVMTALFAFYNNEFAIMGADSLKVTIESADLERKAIKEEYVDKIFTGKEIMIGVYGQTDFPDGSQTDDFIKSIINTEDVVEKIKKYTEIHKEHARFQFGFYIIKKGFSLTHIFTLMMNYEKWSMNVLSDSNCLLYGHLGQLNKLQ